MVASQMADALFDVTTAEIEATPRQGSEVYLLRATNTQLRFPGFRQVYVEGRDEEDDEEALGTNPMPELAVDDLLKLLELLPEQHFTEPPPRYTEASLVKVLEEKGIGRPSTYAPTMTTIHERGYVEKEGRYLRPSDLGFVVNDLLVEHFPDFVNVGFTADMEVDLDEVARGERPWQPMVKEFHDPLEEALVRAAGAPKQEKTTDERCPECDRPMIIRWGRRGQFLACSGFPECRTTRSLDGEDETPQTTDETCQECSAPMVVKTGRFGRFLACSRYPECKGRRPLTAKTGVNCPRCGADIVERRSKRGRTFFGCSSYPKCDFTVWSRPLSQPCPQCQGLLTAERDGQAKCNACDWRGEVEAHEPEPTTVV
ncbi:MAG: DNA topoisomerase, partial [Dehalococcoidia bacterium]